MTINTILWDMTVNMFAWGSGAWRGHCGMLYRNVAHTLLSPIIFLRVSAFYNSLSCRDRTGLRSWIRAGLPSASAALLFLINGGIPPWLLSGSEVLIITGSGYKMFSSTGVALGVFISGLWTLLLAADQGRRDGHPPSLYNFYPIYSGIVLTRAAPILIA